MSMLGAGIPTLALKKAKLVVVEGDPDHRSLSFKYNPETFSFSRTVQWTDWPEYHGEGDPPEPTYQRSDPATLSMEIFFDAFEELRGDVTGDVLTLFSWTKPCPPEINGVSNPPLLEFRWGKSRALRDFRGYLSSVSATYSMFRMDGTPIRATCTISMTEVPNPAEGTNPTSGGRPGLQSHVLIDGESLHSVAWAQYGRADFWRAIAAYNEIDDPLRVAPGTRLLLPPHREAARLA
jgi:hypothetical protein